MEIESYEHGVPSWVDLGTPDLAGAAAFYAALFGWDVQEGPPETGGYAIAHLRDRAVAGIGPQQNPGPPAWSTYVNVVDADEIAGKVGPAGGELFMEPFDVTDVGRMAFLADPTGAAIGIWQARAHKGAGIVNEPGAYSWSELVTTDVDGAKDFYAAVFGWASESHGPPTGPGGYTEFKVSDHSIAGMMAKPPDMPAEVPSFWSVYFTVVDTDAAMARVVELGGASVTPAMDIEPGRFAVVADPAGALFSVIAPKEGLGRT